MPSLSRFPHFTPRRSHLDSNSYRTLVRILSHCIDGSLLLPQQPRSSTDPTPRSYDSLLEESSKFLSAENDAISDRTIANELGRRREGEGHGGDCRDVVSKDPSFPSPRFVAAPDGNFASVEESRRREGQPVDAIAETSRESRHGDGLKQRNVCEDGKILIRANHDQVRHENSEGQSRKDELANNELLRGFIFDCPGLTDVLNDISEKLLDDDNSELQNDAVIMTNPESHDLLGRTSSLPVYSKFKKSHEREDGSATSENSKANISRGEMHGSLGELQSGETRQEERRECFYSESAKETAFEKITTEEGQIEECQPVKEIRGLQQEISIFSYPRNLDEPQVSLLTVLVNNGEIEEGEIPDQVQILEDQKPGEDSFVKQGITDRALATFSNKSCVDGHIRTRENNCREEECNFPIYDRNDGIARTSSYDSFLKAQMKEIFHNGIKVNADSQAVVLDDALGLQGHNSANLAIQIKGNPFEVKDVEDQAKKNQGPLAEERKAKKMRGPLEDVEGQAKKKRGPLTEERKAKKMSAKKRKRAQKANEGGVKRLKLQPIVKSKIVKHCNFFMVGKCQQGDLCKFSHDTIPLTKSQPCKYFACDSCLKGEDCPFDHELSMYPCHNYMSKGMCSRGDRCKFSHKMSVIEGSTTTALSKSDFSFSLGKQLNANSTALVANGPPKTTTSSPPFSMNKHLGTNSVKCLEETVQVPKGICFLSFGKGSSDSVNKHYKLLLGKHGGVKICNQENQEKFLAGQYKSAMISEQKPLVTARSESNMKLSGGLSAFTNKESKNSSFSTGPLVAPFQEVSKVNFQMLLKFWRNFYLLVIVRRKE